MLFPMQKHLTMYSILSFFPRIHGGDFTGQGKHVEGSIHGGSPKLEDPTKMDLGVPP